MVKNYRSRSPPRDDNAPEASTSSKKEKTKKEDTLIPPSSVTWFSEEKTREEQFEYFKFRQHELNQETSTDWICVDKIHEESAMVLEQPLVPVDHRKFVNFHRHESEKPIMQKFQPPQC
ncbi:hypothetical protein CAEBREN_13161 [Caenorhabditis brenneri]|uniref:Uncharacterized protein n=1 Tax=Caenorhabditis brenneri TaxID=135651 RepID=G0N171_CAEBE|nr:hypothetical protein CAEBREN_13161 [Caenorhabditis brenneri]